MIEFEWQCQMSEGGRRYSLHPCTLDPFGQDAVFISQSSQRSQCNGDFPLCRCSSNCSSRASINCACRCRLVYLRCVIECTGGGGGAGEGYIIVFNLVFNSFSTTCADLFLSLAGNEYAAYSIIVRPAFISFQRDD